MMVEWGHFALILSCCGLVGVGGALVTSSVSLADKFLRWHLTFLTLAVLVLVIAFIQNDFSVRYVAEHSHTHLPLAYRLSAVWGGHEGSILLWIWLLSGWTWVARQKLSQNFAVLKTFLLGTVLLNLSLHIFLLWTSNPFLRWLPIAPGEGRDLNPLLQDPGLMSHPPLLYIGYVGFSVIAMLALAAWRHQAFSPALIFLLRRLVLSAWSFLTIGITLGSWWAYRVLGWGGFWFWDPVENGSLMPWFCGTILIHALLLVQKYPAFRKWFTGVSVLAFLLSLLGTFLVRSGILISVHTFAVDPKRGIFILLILALSTLLSVALFFSSRLKISFPISSFTFWSKETFLLSNQAILLVLLATVMLGTLYPLILSWLGSSPISIGPPYYNTVAQPLLVLLLMSLLVGPICHWESDQKSRIARILSPSLGLALMSLIGIGCWKPEAASLWMGFILWIFWSLILDRISSLSMRVAHLGFVVMLVGILQSSLLGTHREVLLKPQEMVQVGPYQVQFLDVTELEGPNYHGIQAQIWLKDQREMLLPEQRYYPATHMALAHVAIRASLWDDLYIALGEPSTQEAWSFRCYHKPFVRWIWIGGLLMAMGGLLGAVRRSGRVRVRQSDDPNPNPNLLSRWRHWWVGETTQQAPTFRHLAALELDGNQGCSEERVVRNITSPSYPLAKVVRASFWERARVRAKMKKSILNLIGAGVMGSLFSFLWNGLHHDPHDLGHPMIGAPLPAFALESLKDSRRIVHEDQLKGHLTVINVWASWCPACLAEHEFWVKKRSHLPVYFIGLNFKDSRESALHWLKLHQDPYQEVLWDPQGTLTLALGVTGTPETFLLDQTGEIVYHQVGIVTDDDWQKEFLSRIQELSEKKHDPV